MFIDLCYQKTNWRCWASPTYWKAWEIQDAITEKSGIVALSISVLSPSKDNKNSDDLKNNTKVGLYKKSQSVIKAYHANALLQLAVWCGCSSASKALASLTLMLSPAALKGRDNNKLQHLIQLSDHKTTVDMLQMELREVHRRVDELTDRLF